MSRHPGSSRASQRASVLITTMILLMMLTVLGLAMISLNTTQTRMATNSADAQAAYQSAEGALNQAAANVQAGNYPPDYYIANTNGLYAFNPANAPLWTTVAWTSASGAIQCTACGASPNAAYIIEALPAVNVQGLGLQRVYRVTARAVGISGNSPVLLQATVLTP
jgi:type IV pilus assembly protein PilX